MLSLSRELCGLVKKYKGKVFSVLSREYVRVRINLLGESFDGFIYRESVSHAVISILSSPSDKVDSNPPVYAALVFSLIVWSSSWHIYRAWDLDFWAADRALGSRPRLRHIWKFEPTPRITERRELNAR